MSLTVRILSFLALVLPVFGAEYLSEPNVIPSEAAAKEVLRLSAEKASMRLWGLDLFPHVSGNAQFDDNVLINDTNRVRDFILTGAPGLTVTAGDVANYLPGAITVEMLRNYITYTAVDEQTIPRRFVAVDYTPKFNLYTQNERFNNVDHSANFSAAYAWSRLALDLNADFVRAQGKNNDVGSLIVYNSYTADLHGRYDFTEGTSLDVSLQYLGLAYDLEQYEGYSEFRNEDYLNRQLSERLKIGAGIGLGYVIPDNSDNQTYQQALLRAVYRATGKLFLNASAGLEVREYESGDPATLHPVFNITGTYFLTERTTFILEAHRRDQPASQGGYNYTLLGFSGGVRQLLWNRLYANVNASYENIDFRTVANVATATRMDNIIAGRLCFDYEFNQHWKATAFYSYQKDASNQPGFDYQNNITGVRLSWTF